MQRAERSRGARDRDDRTVRGGRDVLRLHGEFAPCVAVDVDLRILRPHTPRRQPLLQRLLSNAAPPASATFVAAKPTASWRARQLP